jgi:ligand-binding SRPBCC domain-containing protein
MPYFLKQSQISASADAVFAWHEKPDAFASILPPWEKMKVLSQSGLISESGSQITLRIYVFGPIFIDWVSEHHGYIQGREFKDTQLQGPFQYWEHTHRVLPVDETHCVLEDSIEYELPFSPLSNWVAGWYVHRKLSRMFDYRHEQMQKIFN